MKKVYICSPYRAKNGVELDRNIEYAQALTKQAIRAGLAPVTPHLYIAQCLNEGDQEERAAGMAAGLELLQSCDFVLAGIKYGISEGMAVEMAAAKAAQIDVVYADRLADRLLNEQKKKEETVRRYVNLHTCSFCRGRHFHTCSLFNCQEPARQAYEYAWKHYNNGAIDER